MTALRLPPPDWLAGVLGEAPTEVVVSGALPRLRLSISTSAGVVRMLIVGEQTLCAAWQSTGGERASAPLTDSTVAAVRRLDAIVSERPDALSGEEAVAVAAGRRLTEEAPGLPPDAPRDLRLWEAVRRGAWTELFHSLEEDAAAASWLAPLLAGVVGDVEVLRGLGEVAEPSGLSAVAGVGWQATGFEERAIAALESATETLMGRERASLALRIGKLQREVGAEGASVDWLRRAIMLAPDDDSLLLRAAFELMRSGAAADAASVLAERCGQPNVPPPIALAYAELLLFAGDVTAAAPWLERAKQADEDPVRRDRAQAIGLALSGEWDRARAAFEALHEEHHDAVSATWLVEAHLHLGDRDAAEAMLRLARAAAQSPVHIVLQAAVSGHGPSQDRELRAMLEWLGEPADEWPPPSDEAAVDLSHHWRLLARFGGNRGTPATLRDPSRPPPQLAPVMLPASSSRLSSREAAADCLKGFGRQPISEIEQAFERVAERYPESPHPLCYWGELDLWVGDYDAAIQRFQAGLARGEARWGYVGQAAAYILQRDFDAADAVLHRLSRTFEPVVGATTQVYLGEAHRRRGRFDEARALLREAVAAKPGRLAAWMNLALTELALGDEVEATRILREVEAWAPRLLWDAAHGDGGRGEPLTLGTMPRVFDAALTMMRGNRSSHRPSYFDHRGRLHVVTDARGWQKRAARNALYVRRGIQSSLLAGRSPFGSRIDVVAR